MTHRFARATASREIRPPLSGRCSRRRHPWLEPVRSCGHIMSADAPEIQVLLWEPRKGDSTSEIRTIRRTRRLSWSASCWRSYLVYPRLRGLRPRRRQRSRAGTSTGTADTRPEGTGSQTFERPPKHGGTLVADPPRRRDESQGPGRFCSRTSVHRVGKAAVGQLRCREARRLCGELHAVWLVPERCTVPHPIHIVEDADKFILLAEQNTWFTIVYTDGRPHDKEIASTWYGDTIGHWDGDTLILETVNLNGYAKVDTISPVQQPGEDYADLQAPEFRNHPAHVDRRRSEDLTRSNGRFLTPGRSSRSIPRSSNTRAWKTTWRLSSPAPSRRGRRQKEKTLPQKIDAPRVSCQASGRRRTRLSTCHR